MMYVAVTDAKKTQLNQKLLRELSPEERILEVHVSLNQKRYAHEFYALFPAVLEKPEEPASKPKELPEKAFKDGT